MRTKTKVSDTTLYWNEQGAIACEKHTPYRGSDTWTWGRWQEITAIEAAAFFREIGKLPACEQCDAIARSKARRS